MPPEGDPFARYPTTEERLLRDLIAEVRALRADIAAMRPKPAVPSGGLLDALLPAVAERLGSDPWTAADLLDEFPELLRDVSAKRLGKMLAAVQDGAVNGLVVRRGAERHYWTVEAAV
jgi:hypothetical protein